MSAPHHTNNAVAWTIRLTTEERDAIEARAIQVGLQSQTYARLILRQSAGLHLEATGAPLMAGGASSALAVAGTPASSPDDAFKSPEWRTNPSPKDLADRKIYDALNQFHIVRYLRDAKNAAKDAGDPEAVKEIEAIYLDAWRRDPRNMGPLQSRAAELVADQFRLEFVAMDGDFGSEFMNDLIEQDQRSNWRSFLDVF